MMGGGYYRAGAVLLSGAPGTAKTTLSGAFILAACERGERCLYVGFDEPAHEIVRNLRSVGIDLGPHVTSGLLHIQSIRSSLTGAEEHIGTLRNLLDVHQPRCFVIDPLSAIVNSDVDGGHRRMPEQLLALTKAEGITLVCTSLLAGNDAMQEGSITQVSTVADTWIHISYAIRAGERNRALTIIKSRGTEHSNQVRELVLDSSGVTLADVYLADGEVLMGTARWQKEAAEKTAAELLQTSIEHKRLELELVKAEINSRIDVLHREAASKQAELEMLLATEANRLEQIERTRDDLLKLRSGDSQ
jgi:circadian clock protein KaiC